MDFNTAAVTARRAVRCQVAVTEDGYRFQRDLPFICRDSIDQQQLSEFRPYPGNKRWPSLLQGMRDLGQTDASCAWTQGPV